MSTWDAATSAWILQSDDRFLYDAWNLIASYRVTATGDLLLTATYLWGTDLSETAQGAGGIGGLLATRQSGLGGTHLPIDDGHGNITGYLDAVTHLPTARFEYFPFGEPRESRNPGALPFGFSSKFTDAETGLVYYGFRYYSPETGRWVSRDPIGERGGVNVYGMVGNDAVNRVDPLGLFDGFGPTGPVNTSGYPTRPNIPGQQWVLNAQNFSASADSMIQQLQQRLPGAEGGINVSWTAVSSGYCTAAGIHKG